jgi:hypothetical protein
MEGKRMLILSMVGGSISSSLHSRIIYWPVHKGTVIGLSKTESLKGFPGTLTVYTKVQMI